MLNKYEYILEVKKDLYFLYSIAAIGTCLLIFNLLYNYEVIDIKQEFIDDVNVIAIFLLFIVFFYWIIKINMEWYNKCMLIIRVIMFAYIYLYTYTDIFNQNFNMNAILFRPLHFHFVNNNNDNNNENIINDNIFNIDNLAPEYAEYANLVNTQLNDQLVMSCKLGLLDNVKTIIKYGANIHYNNELPLITAYQYNHIDIIKYILSFDDKVNIYAQNNSIFKYACKTNNLPLVLDLLDLDKLKDGKFIIELENATINKCYIKDTINQLYADKKYDEFLEKSKLKKQDTDNNAYNEDCYMCLDEKDKIKYSIYLPCKHKICYECFMSYYYFHISNNQCGYCKEEFEINDCCYKKEV